MGWLRKLPGSNQRRGMSSPFFIGVGMKELSIFIDESGDFGEYKYHSPYYIISLVFHEQNNDITNLIKGLDEKLSFIGDGKNWVHVGPIVRHEEDYKNMDIYERRKILKTFVTFVKKCPIAYKCFYIEKKHLTDELESITKLSKQISNFLKDNLKYFNNFDIVKIYYDNGQIEITKMLISIFYTLFSNVAFRKVTPSQYKLFQVADLFCYFKLLSLKLDNKTLSANEVKFFEKKYYINRYYIKEFKKLEFK